MESLQPELYAQTSLESMEGSCDGGDSDGDGDVDPNCDVRLRASPLGQIHFSLAYDEQKKMLIVKIIEASHLPTPFSNCITCPQQQQQSQQQQQQPLLPGVSRRDQPHSNT